jgi:hypothetical protein
LPEAEIPRVAMATPLAWTAAVSAEISWTQLAKAMAKYALSSVAVYRPVLALVLTTVKPSQTCEAIAPPAPRVTIPVSSSLRLPGVSAE